MVVDTGDQSCQDEPIAVGAQLAVLYSDYTTSDGRQTVRVLARLCTGSVNEMGRQKALHKRWCPQVGILRLAGCGLWQAIPSGIVASRRRGSSLLGRARRDKLSPGNRSYPQLLASYPQMATATRREPVPCIGVL